MSDSPTRPPIVGGNWKMNTQRRTAVELAARVAARLGRRPSPEIVIFPPFPYLIPVAEALAGSRIALGAQDVYHEPDGPFTGEISVSMLKDCGCTWVLTGHSERRHVLGETDDLVNRKTKAALESGLNVIVCIGETRAQRENGEADAVNVRQLTAALSGVPSERMSRVVVAYEPVWAIGTGLTATPEDAQAAHEAIRRTLELYGPAVATATRIQYGGSVKPSNAATLFARPDIDGGLIGGASLNADDFAAIVEAAPGPAVG